MTDCNTEHMIAQLEDEAIQELQGGPAPELICTDLKKPLNNDEKAKELSCDDSVSDICQAAKITIKTPTPEYVKSLRFRPISLEELLKMPSKEWLVEHLFGAKDLGMIYGPPGCGKTFVIIDLIYSMCLGEKWANKFDIKRPLTVWYCAGEGISGLQARFAAAADNRGIESLENLSFFDKIPQFFDLTNGDGINEFIEDFELRQKEEGTPHPDVVIIDTLNCAAVGADENSAKEMGVVMRNARRVAEKLGCAVFFIHHTTKGGTAERGSGSMRGAMEIMMEILPGTDAGISAGLSCSKIKDEEKWDTAHFHLQKSESIPSAHVEWFKPGEVMPQGSGDQLKYRIIKEMESCPEHKFTINTLSLVIYRTPSYTNKLLKQLEKDGKCRKELSDTTKQYSPSNPYVFYI